MDNTKTVIIKTLDDMNELDYYSFLDEDTKNKLNKGEKINCDKATMILLTHHLLYVFYGKINNEQLFKVGAYVISEIVKDYYDGQIYDNNSNYQCNNHHSSRELFNQFVNSHLVYSQDNDTWYLKASIPANENIKKYFVSNNLIKNNYVKFVPNATITDYYKLFNSFDIYRGELFPQELVDSDNIEDMSRRLFNLTYAETPTKTDVKDYSELLYVVNDKKDFETEKSRIKQLLQVVRDYFYNPIFSNCLKCVIGDKRFDFLKGNTKNSDLLKDFLLN